MCFRQKKCKFTVEKFEVLRVEDCNFSPSKENSKLFLTVRGNQYFEPFVENEIVLNIEFPNETSATVYSQRTGKASIILYFRDVELSSLYEVIRSSIKDSDNPYISLENVITPAAFRNKGIGTYLFSIWLQYVAQICIIQGMFPKEICGKQGDGTADTKEFSTKLYEKFNGYSIENVLTLHLHKDELENKHIHYTIDWNPSLKDNPQYTLFYK